MEDPPLPVPVGSPPWIMNSCMDEKSLLTDDHTLLVAWSFKWTHSLHLPWLSYETCNHCNTHFVPVFRGNLAFHGHWKSDLCNDPLPTYQLSKISASLRCLVPVQLHCHITLSVHRATWRFDFKSLLINIASAFTGEFNTIPLMFPRPLSLVES